MASQTPTDSAPAEFRSAELEPALRAGADLMSALGATIVALLALQGIPIRMSVRHETPSVPSLPEIEDAQLMSSRLGRVVYAALGFLSLGVGIAGYVVPVLPGTIFLLLATYFFFRSSDRMYRWVLNHPRFGPTVRAYRAGYGIPRRIKVYAIGLMLISVMFSLVFAVDGVAIRVFLVALAALGATFILTRPTTEDVLAEV